MIFLVLDKHRSAAVTVPIPAGERIALCELIFGCGRDINVVFQAFWICAPFGNSLHIDDVFHRAMSFFMIVLINASILLAVFLDPSAI